MFFKKKVHGEKLLTCPRCKIKMRKIKKKKIILDVCDKCNGMWLDNGEMEKLAKMAQEIKGGGKVGKKAK